MKMNGELLPKQRQVRTSITVSRRHTLVRKKGVVLLLVGKGRFREPNSEAIGKRVWKDIWVARPNKFRMTYSRYSHSLSK